MPRTASWPGDVRHLLPHGRWEPAPAIGLELWRTLRDRRAFFLVEANPDDPAVRVHEAWDALLAALPHGWGVRFLWIVSPDGRPRAVFLQHLQQWPSTSHTGRGQWRQALHDFLFHAPLPFERTLLLEIVLPLQSDSAFLSGLPALLAEYGLAARPLSQTEIEPLSRALFRPEV